MARKLNWLGKTVVIIAVALILGGAFFGAKFAYSHLKGVSLPELNVGKAGAKDLANGFATTVNNGNYSTVLKLLSADIPKLESETTFASKLEGMFGSAKLKLESLVIEGEKGYAVYSMEGKTELFTLPLIKEDGVWRINYFANEARCSNACAAATCKDDKILIDCSDTDSDNCTEGVEQTCPVACSGGKCVAVKEIYTLKTDEVLTAFPSKIKILTFNSDGSVTLEVGDDLGIFTEENPQTLEGLTITVMDVGTSSVTLKVKAV